MIYSVIGDSFEKLAQHDDYGHFGGRKLFYLGLSRQLQNWVHQSTPPSLGQHNRLIIKFKPTLDCSWSGRLTFPPFPSSRAFDSRTSAGHLQGGNRVGQILHFSDVDNIGDSNLLLTRGLSNNRRLDNSHTIPSFRSVSSILPANHNNIIRLLQIINDITIYLRQNEIPLVVHRVFAHTTRIVNSTQQHWNPVVCNEILLSKQGSPRKTLHATDGRGNGVTTNSDTVKVQLKSGYPFCRTTLK